MPALGVGRRQFLMALKRQLILCLARDVPGLGHQLAMLAHGQPGTRLAVAREFGDQMFGTQLQEGFQFVAGGFRAVGLQEDFAQAFADTDRRIRGGVHATGDAAVDLAQGNLVRHQQRRLQPGAARLLDVIGRSGGRQSRPQYALAREVHVPRQLEHRPGDHFADALAVQVVTFDQAFEGGGEHHLVTGRGVGAVGAGEGNPVTADDRDAAQLGHEELLTKDLM
ncbi:hypothetical protein D3C86_1306650 [compost metagenome]